MNIRGFHFANSILACSNKAIIPNDYIEGLFRNAGDINLCYNLNWFIAELCKRLKLTPDELKGFYEKGDITLISGIKLTYFADRFVSMKDFYMHRFALFNDGQQYREDNKVSVTEESPLKEAIEVAKLGEEVYQAFINIGLHPKSLTSPIKTWSEEVLSKISLPTIADIPIDFL